MILLQSTSNKLLGVLQSIAGIVESKHTNQILANVLIQKESNILHLTTTDKNIQISTTEDLGGDNENFSTTINIRKIIDILKTMDNEQNISLEYNKDKILLKGGKSRFTLQTLSANDFPLIQEELDFGSTLNIPQKVLKDLIAQVSFSMAVQDIRYYLNGIMFIAENNSLSLIATDGHRLALIKTEIEGINIEEKQEVILPRKTVLELQRLLSSSNNEEDLVSIKFATNKQAKFNFANLEFVSELVDGQFPNYQKVIPVDNKKLLTLNKEILLKGLQRTAIMTNDKFKGVRLNLENNLLKISASNNEQEEAIEELDIDYKDDEIEIGFNVTYLIDVLKHVTTNEINMTLQDSNSATLITMPENDNFKYVVMPMRI